MAESGWSKEDPTTNPEECCWNAIGGGIRCSTDVSDSQRRQGRGVIQSKPDVASRHGPDLEPEWWGRRTAPFWTAGTNGGGASRRVAEEHGQRVSRVRRVET